MICQAAIRAVDAHNALVSERLIPHGEVGDMLDHVEEFTDTLERRGVRFSRVLIELIPTVAKAPERPAIGGYRSLFPEFFPGSGQTA
jgi:hypothetical protein